MFKHVTLGLLLSLFCSLVLATETPFIASAASSLGPISIEVAGLQDQLEKGLRARRPEEFRFITAIVGMVERGKLRLELVQGTFHWVRKHKAGVRFPFVYFEQALRKRAKQEGVVLPPLA